jgi:hypothetical protein
MFHYHRQMFGRLTSPGERPARDPHTTIATGLKQLVMLSRVMFPDSDGRS